MPMPINADDREAEAVRLPFRFNEQTRQLATVQDKVVGPFDLRAESGDGLHRIDGGHAAQDRQLARFGEG
jgi:hypothetical protein